MWVALPKRELVGRGNTDDLEVYYISLRYTILSWFNGVLSNEILGVSWIVQTVSSLAISACHPIHLRVIWRHQGTTVRSNCYPQISECSINPAFIRSAKIF
jgi:hypothetical protein